MSALLVATWAASSRAAEPDRPSYSAAISIPLPDGRWDLLSVDSVHHRVLVARGDSVTIVDLANGTARSAGSLTRGHAAVAIDGTDLVAVTSGGDDSVRLINAATGEQTASIAVGQNPDAAFYDPRSKHLIVMNAKGGTVSIVDPQAAKVVSTIAVKPGLELSTLIGPDLLAINDEDTNEIELIDLKRGAMLKPIPLPGCEGPTGIAFDPADGLLLSACANGQAALIDTHTRRLIKLLPIGKGPDGALFDRQRRRFLVPCGQSGTLSVFEVGAGRQVTALPPVKTETSARTAALDAVSGRVYLPAARFEPAAAGGRPTLIAGSVHLIELEPAHVR
ncbi:MAG: YncE family protein [Pseudomonadota bacterium]|nr:YncE family protein [Pseudomonadota bacterium]